MNHKLNEKKRCQMGSNKTTCGDTIPIPLRGRNVTNYPIGKVIGWTAGVEQIHPFESPNVTI